MVTFCCSVNSTPGAVWILVFWMSSEEKVWEDAGAPLNACPPVWACAVAEGVPVVAIVLV